MKKGKIYKSGLVPEGNVRLTTNIKEELHTRLKLWAVRERVTMSEILERLIEDAIPDPTEQAASDSLSAMYQGLDVGEDFENGYLEGYMQRAKDEPGLQD